ncbi:MAG: glycoside hydrolase family 15 protein [Desulfobulbaceae bacterium]|nr:glycoside hydrolase family 15 protein [Desulfobulbaceae bacterium]
MPRDLPIGNGSLLINFDHTCQIRDIYWPYVGQENHTNGRVFRLGVWVNGRFSWLESEDWQRELTYGKDSLVTESILENSKLGIKLRFRDAVDFHENLLIRQCSVENHTDQEQEIRLFFCHDLSISGTTVGDSAYYQPQSKALFHYKGKRWFMIGLIRGWPKNWQDGLDQWAVGIKDVRELEGSWRDVEDGELSGNPVAQGRIDSVAALHLKVEADGQATGWYVMTVGEDFDAVTRLYRAVLRKGPISYLDRTAAYWQLWANKENDRLKQLPPHLVSLYRRSLLVLRTQIDNHGAIIAANDFDIAQFNRDTYSYMWPRDGALVAATLIDAGYSEITRRFFDFCHEAITDQGFLLHKYTPDGSLASSWHAWYADGECRLPIQQDETALVLWAMWHHFSRFRDVEFIKLHYRGLVIRAAEWICSYIDEENGLPLPSWDLWEERYGVHSWTVASVWAGLQAAANFAEAFGENNIALRYRRTASQMRKAAGVLLWDETNKTFIRSLVLDNESHYTPDLVMDSSLVGLWYFGMFAADDPKIIPTMQTMRSRLWVQTDVGGMARYENDYYHQVSKDIDKVPGNPWFICTLWLAQWLIASAKIDDDLDQAMQLIDWTASRTLASGVMAEQVHPYTNEPLSVSPLTWSHATYVATILDYERRARALTEK